MVKIFALIGEAGSGKDHLVKILAEQYPALFNEIISCTTRPKREFEKDGVDYYFLSEDFFLERETTGEILASTFFKNWYYGILTDSLCEDTKINIGAFNLEEIKRLKTALKKRNIEFEMGIYRLATTPKERLLRQLQREKNPDVDEIVRRYEADKRDFKNVDTSLYAKYLFNNTEEDLNLNIEIIKTDAMRIQDSTN